MNLCNVPSGIAKMYVRTLMHADNSTVIPSYQTFQSLYTSVAQTIRSVIRKTIYRLLYIFAYRYRIGTMTETAADTDTVGDKIKFTYGFLNPCNFVLAQWFLQVGSLAFSKVHNHLNYARV